MGILNVLIIEDDLKLRTRLELIIQAEDDMNVSGMARNRCEAIDNIKQSRPDMVLLDLQLPEKDGIACIKEIRKLYAGLHILILTTIDENEYMIIQSLVCGVNGYLLKELDSKKLVQTIRYARNDQFILPAEVAAIIARYALNDGTYMKERGIARYFEHNQLFSKKEQAILLMLQSRLTNKEIAAKLLLTEGTIKNNLTLIYEKLNARNRQEAIRQLELLVKTQHSV